MTRADLFYLTPLMIIASAPVMIMLIVSIFRDLRVVYSFSVFMFMSAFMSVFILPGDTHYIGTMLVVDTYALYLQGIFYLAGLLITVMSYEYLKDKPGEREEYFIIFFVAVLGASLLVISHHFVSFFLGMETLSISLYIMVSYLRHRDTNIEAGMKFLVIASLATSFLLFGMGLVYAETGSMNFEDINRRFLGWSPLMLTGTSLIIAGMGFKLALVPFHMWTPDIYQGAPLPVTALIATISKGAMMGLAIRFFILTRGFDNYAIFMLISVIALLSMFVGNLLALNQMKVKRILAYSSIANLGYLLITLLTGTDAGIQSAIFYIIVYIITNLGAFGVLSMLSACEKDADHIDDLKGLFRGNPLAATVMAVSMLSLAGLPLTAGFMSKFFLVLAGVEQGLWILALGLVINSVISLYYYLRIIKTMITPDPDREKVAVAPVLNVMMVVILFGILFLGLYPSFLMGTF